MSKTITLNGRKIPLTKSGLPNKRYLNKVEKAALEVVLKKNSKLTEEKLMEQFSQLINNK